MKKDFSKFWSSETEGDYFSEEKEAADFLKAKSFNHINEFFKTKPEKNYLIASWREFDGIDSEESEGGIIELTKAIEKVNDLKNILEKSSHK